jgi:hypothetical protein
VDSGDAKSFQATVPDAKAGHLGPGHSRYFYLHPLPSSKSRRQFSIRDGFLSSDSELLNQYNPKYAAKATAIASRAHTHTTASQDFVGVAPLFSRK